jgi:uncharacterized protein YbaR (Trm112 family)
MRGLEEWLPPVSAGTKTGLQIAQANIAKLFVDSRHPISRSMTGKMKSFMAVSKELLEILVCPVCKSKVLLKEDGSGLKCVECKRVYPVRDDIPIMLRDQATIEA